MIGALSTLLGISLIALVRREHSLRNSEPDRGLSAPTGSSDREMREAVEQLEEGSE